jgi:hypothetical protein
VNGFLLEAFVAADAEFKDRKKLVAITVVDRSSEMLGKIAN